MNFSIALTTFQSEAYLDIQLDSLLAQTKKPFELIVCDDGSSDGTLAILEKFKAMAPFPVSIHKNEKNFGYAQNFAKAISLCRGDWIFLCDHDDRWHPEKLAYFAERIEQDHSLVALFSDSTLVDSKLQPLGATLFQTNRFHSFERDFIRQGEAWRAFLRHNVVAGHALAFKASLSSKLLPIPHGWVHDAWISTMLAQLGKMDFITEQLVEYRQHENQHIGVISGGILTRLLARLERIGQRSDFAKEAECWKALAAKTEWQKPVEARNALESKIKWLEGRARMPGWAPLRLPFLLLNSRFYFRFDNGWQTILKDLFIR
jgi:glycosyltransferase involved in cell wall biosynthesis